MDFFSRQASSRRQSQVLLLGFVAALLTMGAVIHVVIAGFSVLLGETDSLREPSVPALALIGLVWLTIVLGGFFRALDVRAGGAALARRFGAVHASDRSRHEQEKQLLNVVAEVSIAASCPQPEVYVLRNEASINALVVGTEATRHVIVVTQGALDSFDRDELQAVVAHEFGHICNGDLPVNMRLLVALGGLMAIDEVGCLLVGKSPDDHAHPGVLVGYLLRIFGSIGVFFGSLISAAFSRQREYLADAMAAQFTRNPYALASALNVIREQGDSVGLHSAYSRELAHLCFQTGKKRQWYKRLFSTHPDIQKRIDIIEPYFAIKKRKRQKEKHGSLEVSRGALAHGYGTPGGSMPESSPLSSPGTGVTSGGGRDAEPGLPMYNGDVNHTGLSDRIMLLLPDESSCLAALFALFASDNPMKRRDYLGAVTFGFNQRFAAQVKELLVLAPDELKHDQLGIIEHATRVLRKSIQFDNRQRILIKLERLLSVSGEFNLMNYATLQLVRRKLDVEFPIVETVANERSPLAEGRRVKTFDTMGSEFALLLSLMVESSGASAEQLDAEFSRVLKCYTSTEYPRRTANESGIVKELEAAFQTLYVQPKPIRQAFVHHCIEIMDKDGHVARAEQMLLGLFAAALGCEELAAA